ncbi:MAG: thymidine phosphorylase [Candidatus Kapabacteria bacterium]|nr:thymidine phosphorylase [Candidatus Kapabacteria bacterium]
MIVAELLRKKRDGLTLSPTEIEELITGIVHGSVTTAQAAAFLMAACIRGLTEAETVALTRAMAHSGTCYDWRSIGYAVDKHSTGGVGDKISLLVAPIAAAAGAIVPMMSGRGLGHTGGTIDKLESIVGFTVHPSDEQIERQLRRLGVAMFAQSAKVAPADRILYALRDETGTVESVGLITASILSKKIAEGAQGLVLDVKIGRGAFMQHINDARALAQMLVAVGQGAGLTVRGVLTDMDDPLGCAVGNWVEVQEAEGALQNPSECPPDIRELSLYLAGAMLHLAGIASSQQDGMSRAAQVWENGQAYERFHEMVAAQGGRWQESVARYVSTPSLTVESPRSGYITGFSTRQIGLALVELGAGRKRAQDTIDPAAGVVLHVQRGNYIECGAPLFTVYATDKERIPPCAQLLLQSIEIEESPPLPRTSLIYEAVP